MFASQFTVDCHDETQKINRQTTSPETIYTVLQLQFGYCNLDDLIEWQTSKQQYSTHLCFQTACCRVHQAGQVVKGFVVTFEPLSSCQCPLCFDLFCSCFIKIRSGLNSLTLCSCLYFAANPPTPSAVECAGSAGPSLIPPSLRPEGHRPQA